VEFYTSFRITLWEGSEDADDVYHARIADLRRFFFALQARNYTRNRESTPRDCLVRLVGLQTANAIEFPEVDPNEGGGSVPETTGSNPILSALFANLDVSKKLPHDRPMEDGFQHAVTNIAFQTINASRSKVERLHTHFGPDAPWVSPEKITRIIHGVVNRYAIKLWPKVVGVDPLPYWLLMALQEYILALIQIPAVRAPRDEEDTMRVCDNILGLNQSEIQAGHPTANNGEDCDDGGDEADDGLECPLKDLGTSESCSTPFATALDLGRHMVEMHEFIEEDARDVVWEAEMALKERESRRS
jgi:hypothetical protein